MGMTLTEGQIEEGKTYVGNREIEVSRILTQRHGMFVDLPSGQQVANFTEILKGDGERDNTGVLEVGEEIITGVVVQRRRKFDRAHRQSVFVADQGFEVIISSDEV
jgi:hypothetical protein